MRYVGFARSFGGKYYGGRVKSHYNSDNRDRVASQYKASLKASKLLQGCLLYSQHYERINPVESIIYCDPPYRGVQGYGVSFNNDLFWNRVRRWVESGNKVFISEYTAPDDFVCVWEKEINTTLNTNNQKAIEKLFVHKSQR